jgi:hypothetical protein
MVKIKLPGIYKIEHISGYYYVGMSVDIFSRWESHYTEIRMKTHSSTELMELWNRTDPSEWTFTILEYVSVTKWKSELVRVKKEDLKTLFRRYLLNREKDWMRKYSRNFALNKDKKNFS